MSILVNIHQLRKSFSARPLFDGLTFSIRAGERIGLIGPNGAGKSTLLKIIAGHQNADDGTVSLQRGLRVGYLQQVPQFSEGATVFSTVMEGAVDEFDWEESARAHEWLSRLSLNAEDLIENLSGGWKKRVALAREMMKQPDLLLLDEPTNHLDVESILWLEEFLAQASFATLTITHDRLFLNRIANRILELDRRNAGGVLSVEGDYAKYLEVREERVATQNQQELRLKNKLRRETEWLRQGAKARTTKQQARIQRQGELQDVVDDLTYRNQTQSVRLNFGGTEKNPKKLIEAKKISKKYDGKVIVPELDLLITPQTRIGLLGVNGCGKSTLIRMVLGQEESDTGSVVPSDQVQVAYFEQNRESLDPAKTVMRSICPSGDYVDFQGRSIHVRSYMDRFLFTGEQLEMQVGKLSGGEQSRLLIARLMLRPANVLVLDEPTNDLDMATLDVLEDVLKEFPGAVILVTHDRFFLDQVAKDILAFDISDTGNRSILGFKGVSQWEAWHLENQELKVQRQKKAAQDAKAQAKATVASKKKLTFNEQRELDGMESTIHVLEKRLGVLTAECDDPSLSTHSVKLGELTAEMGKIQSEIDRLYRSWEELEARK